MSWTLYWQIIGLIVILSFFIGAILSVATSNKEDDKDKEDW